LDLRARLVGGSFLAGNLLTYLPPKDRQIAAGQRIRRMKAERFRRELPAGCPFSGPETCHGSLNQM